MYKNNSEQQSRCDKYFASAEHYHDKSRLGIEEEESD